MAKANEVWGSAIQATNKNKAKRSAPAIAA